MEDHAFVYGVTSDASQYAHMQHFKASSVVPPSPPLLRHESPSPLSYTPDSRRPSQCGQDSCATTDRSSAHDEHESHAHSSDGNIHICHTFEGVELDLNLGYGGHQQELHGFLARAITSEPAEHSTSSISDLDRSANGLAAAQLSPAAASFLAFKSSEGCTPRENTCSSSTNHRLASTQSHQNAGDFDELSPTPKGHSVFQVRVDRSRDFPFVRGALPAHGTFVASHEEKIFLCKFCDRRFHSSQALGGHQNAHKRERLVARSTPVRFGAPAFFCGAPGTPMPYQLPSCRVQHHLVGASEDRPLAAYPLIASMCKDRSHASSRQASMLVTTMCRDRFQAPPLISSMCSSKLELDCSPSSNVYTENRSLGIKAHSLVHKPSVGCSFAPRMGHLKAINVMPAPDRSHHGWARASIDVQQPGVPGCFVPGEDYHSSMHHDTRFLLHMKDERASLLHHHQQHMAFHSAACGAAQPLTNHSNSVKACISSGFLHESDSSSTVVDLALHL